MGLAPFGNPTFTSIIRDHLVDVKDDGSFQLNLAYFDFAVGKQMTNDKFLRCFQSKRETLRQKFHKITLTLRQAFNKLQRKLFCGLQGL